MANFISRRALSRRTFLRGIGAAISLPWLDAMTPALAPFGARRHRGSPARAMFVFHPNGQSLPDFFPATEGTDVRLPFILEPLEPVKRHLTVVSGLGLDAALAHGDGPGDHARAAASFLTCVHPKKTGGADIRAGVSVDQLIAAKVGGATRLPSIEIGCEGGRLAGNCDSGYACAYVNNISWRSPSAPMTKESSPRRIFERLFGIDASAADGEARDRRMRNRLSILDFVRDDAAALRSSLGSEDRPRLDEFLTSLREIERRVADHDAAGKPPPAPEFPAEMDYPTHLKLLYDLAAMALQSDATRVITLMVANGGSNRSYPFAGARDGHHDLSHHGGDPKKIDGVRRINRFHAENLARFLAKLDTTKEGDGTLLERSTVLYGCGIADGDRHDHKNLPILVAGGGTATPLGARHLRAPLGTPLANLHLAVMDRMNVRQASFADSTGRIEL